MSPLRSVLFQRTPKETSSHGWWWQGLWECTIGPLLAAKHGRIASLRFQLPRVLDASQVGKWPPQASACLECTRPKRSVVDVLVPHVGSSVRRRLETNTIWEKPFQRNLIRNVCCLGEVFPLSNDMHALVSRLFLQLCRRVTCFELCSLKARRGWVFTVSNLPLELFVTNVTGTNPC